MGTKFRLPELVADAFTHCYWVILACSVALSSGNSESYIHFRQFLPFTFGERIKNSPNIFILFNKRKTGEKGDLI